MEEFDFKPAYKVAGHGGVAWRVTAWEIERQWDEDEHFERLTGNVVAHMIGDDRDWIFDPADLTPLDDEEFCRECGQIGCGHNVYS